MVLKSSVDVYKNCKTKCYSDGTTNSIICRTGIFKSALDVSLETEKAFEDKHKTESENSQAIIDYLEAKGISYDEYYDRKLEYKRSHKTERKNLNNDVRSDNMKRAKDCIFDYVLNNNFDYFFTGTINPELLDSKEPKALLKPVIDWLKHMVQRYGLSYIMIAEYHPTSGRIHFHGLLRSDKPLRLIDSGTKLYKGRKKPISNEKAELLGLFGGRTVYNLKSWSFGFTTCVELVGDRLNTAFYITKYITKDCKKIFGKFYWHSRDLKKPVIHIHDVDYDSILCVEHNGFKYEFKRGDDNENI